MKKDSSEATPEVIRFRGEQIVMIGHAPNGVGAGDLVCFDLDGNGRFKRRAAQSMAKAALACAAR